MLEDFWLLHFLHSLYMGAKSPRLRSWDDVFAFLVNVVKSMCRCEHEAAWNEHASCHWLFELVPAYYNPDAVIGVPIQVIALDLFTSIYIFDQQFFIWIKLHFAIADAVRKVIAAAGLVAGAVFVPDFSGWSLFLWLIFHTYYCLIISRVI